MKKIFTLFFLFYVLTFYAQPTITTSWLPTIGDKVQSAVGANTEMIEPGESGANVTWDYSTVMKDENVPSALFEYADPSVSSFANLFPDANIAVVVSGTDPNTLPTTFYKMDNDKFELLGNALPMTSFVYSNPQTIMKFPFSFGGVFIDDYAAEGDINGIMSSIYGDVTVTADAYGTIITPNGTYQDVIRIKTEENRIDSTIVAPGSYSLLTQNIVNYVWLSNKIGASVASLSISNGETKTVTGGVTFTDQLEEFRSFSWDNSGTSSLKEVHGNLPLDLLSYGPNPTPDIFSINVNSECNCTIRMEIINNLGELTLEKDINLSYGNNTLDVQLGVVSAGNYFVKLIHEDGFGVFQVQKIY